MKLLFIVLAIAVFYSNITTAQSSQTRQHMYAVAGDTSKYLPSELGYYSDIYRQCLSNGLKQKGFYTDKIFNDCNTSCSKQCVVQHLPRIDQYYIDNNKFKNKKECLSYVRSINRLDKIEKKYEKRKRKSLEAAKEWYDYQLDRLCGDQKKVKGKFEKPAIFRVPVKPYRLRKLSGGVIGTKAPPHMNFEHALLFGCQRQCVDDRVYSGQRKGDSLSERLDRIENAIDNLK